jgi:hypothetical protein
MTASPLHERLRAAAAGLQSERVSLAELAAAHGPAAQGTLLVLMAVPCLLPVAGVGTLLGLGLVAVALALWRGHEPVGLPPRVAAMALPRQGAQRVLGLIAAFYAFASRCSRERLTHLVRPGRCRWLAAAVGAMAVLIVLPIPFGNVLPALALTAFGLGRVFRDGLAVVLGAVFAALALAFTAGLGAAAWHWGGEGLMAWLDA